MQCRQDNNNQSTFIANVDLVTELAAKYRIDNTAVFCFF